MYISRFEYYLETLSHCNQYQLVFLVYVFLSAPSNSITMYVHLAATSTYPHFLLCSKERFILQPLFFFRGSVIGWRCEFARSAPLSFIPLPTYHTLVDLHIPTFLLQLSRNPLLPYVHCTLKIIVSESA